MNIAELEMKLLAAARADAPDTRVPYAFEKRVMSLIGSRPGTDGYGSWARGMWRAAASCAAIPLLFGLWILLSSTGTTGSSDLAQNFESTLLASVDQSDQAE